MAKRLSIIIPTLLLAVAILAAGSFFNPQPDQAKAAEISTIQTLVNKTYPLGAAYAPQDLVPVSYYAKGASGIKLRLAAAEALGEMVKAMKKDGITDIYVNSAYRSYDRQNTLYKNKTAYYRNLGYSLDAAQEKAATVVAKPGTSEHQTGLVVDLSCSGIKYALNESFANTVQGKWLKNNCWKYGFILRYPSDKVATTGYISEPWHFRYVGEPHAEYIMKNNLCLEEYYERVRSYGSLKITAADGRVFYVSYSEDPNDDSQALAINGVRLSVCKAYGSLREGYLITTVSLGDSFTDIINHWGRTYIREMADKGLIKGYPGNVFRPNNSLTRAEYITILSRLVDSLPTLSSSLVDRVAAGNDLDMEEKVFTDINPAAYYVQPLKSLDGVRVIPESLYEANSEGYYFFPQRAILRNEVALILAEVFKAASECGLITAPPEDAVHAPFPDLAQESEQVREAVDLLYYYGVFTGDNMGNFTPQTSLTRAEICTLFSRITAIFDN